MVHIQQAMNLSLEHRIRGPPHYYGVTARLRALRTHPRIHVISIWGDSLDNLLDLQFQL